MNVGFRSSLLVCGAIVWGCVQADEAELAVATEPGTTESVEQPITPELVDQQLRDAQAEFDEAKKMFNPWYTGPLITGSAHILPPGDVNVQPYYFITNNYAAYNKHGKPKKIPHLIVNNPQLVALFGVTDWLNVTVVPQYVHNNQAGQHAGHWGDTPVALGFGILSEKPYRPAVLIGVKESFPTGKYQKLDSHKGAVDATGAGSFETSVNLNISKVVWWLTTHPMSFRSSVNYTVPAKVHVRGINAYGGGSGTSGTVKPGNSFALDLGYEYSFTQRWVAALDVVYNYSWKTTFSGNPGVTAAGPAAVGSPFNEQLSLAPAIEYNPNPNLGFIAGCWFSVWGRNSLDFVSGVFSFTYTF